MDKHSALRAPRMTDEEITQMYATTIKLCQDNKINAKNTWSLNLIDHMSMLVHDDASAGLNADPTSQPGNRRDTNFQVAGATLDAGVRIYCSRVDSVHTNAFKVLGTLSQSAHSRTDAARADDPTRDSGDSYGDDSCDDADADEGKARARRRRAKTSGAATLESNIDNITVKRLDAELVVDPLFQKMSAAFDEGGARGMLLNNLCVNERCEVVFDSSDPAQIVQSASSAQKVEEIGATEAECESQYDVSDVSLEAPAEDLSLCPRFLSFFRARVSASELSQCSEVTNEAGHSRSYECSTDESVHFEYDMSYMTDSNCTFASALNDASSTLGMSYTDSEAPAIPGNDDDVELLMSSNLDDGRHSLDSTASSADRRSVAGDDDLSNLPNHQRLLMSGKIDLLEAGMNLQSNSQYSFFDAAALQSWAGPQHWRFLARHACAVDQSSNKENQDHVARKRPRGKTAMLLDFSIEAPDIDFKAEFAPPKNQASTQLSKTVQENASEKKITLPEDLHYRTEKLTALFLKPSVFVVPLKKRPADGDENGNENEDISKDWYNFENDGDNDNYCAPEEDAPQEFEFEESGVNDKDSTNGGAAADIELVPQPNRVDKVDIGFATVAKRVDVQKLKEGIWAKLRDRETSSASGKASDEADASTENRSATSHVRDTLRGVIEQIPDHVSTEALRDISAPYVFICLLHLANEKVLELGEAADLSDLTIARPDLSEHPS